MLLFLRAAVVFVVALLMSRLVEDSPAQHVFKQTAPVRMCALDLEEVNRTKLGTECTQVQ